MHSGIRWLMTDDSSLHQLLTQISITNSNQKRHSILNTPNKHCKSFKNWNSSFNWFLWIWNQLKFFDDDFWFKLNWKKLTLVRRQVCFSPPGDVINPQKSQSPWKKLESHKEATGGKHQSLLQPTFEPKHTFNSDSPGDRKKRRKKRFFFVEDNSKLTKRGTAVSRHKAFGAAAWTGM